MRVKINKNEYWIKDETVLPLNFDSIKEQKKLDYIFGNKLLHRKDGPAIIFPDGAEWWLDGKLHRTDGPAVLWLEGYKSWWLNGIEVDGEVYQKIQNSSKKILLKYKVLFNYKDYLSLIEYKLNKKIKH